MSRTIDLTGDQYPVTYGCFLARAMPRVARRHVWMPGRCGRPIVFAWGVAALGVGVAHGGLDSGFTPGLYEIEVRIGMPHVLRVGDPRHVRRCVSAADLESGDAFFVLSENPLRACALAGYGASGGVARYRIVCPGPNAAGAEGVFESTATGYAGTISMQMGGKNMTMHETHVATRLGECEVPTER